MNTTTSADAPNLHDTAYDYSFHTLVGHKELPLDLFRGKVVMVVNTASKCGFTPQYARLEKLYEDYKDKGFVILGVPSNDFGSQEPGAEEDIANFCQVNYGVSFPMAAKEVVSGKQAHPFFLWAKQKLGFGTAPKWNFHKYVINRKGELVDYFYSTTSPDAARVIKVVEKALKEEV
ncbi:glutathione peroxidase [Legionella lytica]|uniref:Glutathione peroxidase n=1 Tax=Legionella lytica TaxID=96232 RepID=A0ABW8D9Z7_9GAMM